MISPVELQHENERLRAELAGAREREQRYQRLFGTMQEGFGLAEILLDQEGIPCDYRLLEVNPAFTALTGISPEEARGKTARELAPVVEPHWIETFGRVVETGEPARFEDHLEALGRWFDVSASRTGPLQFAVLLSDVTARKRSETERQEQEARYRQAANELALIYDTAPVGLCCLDTQFRFVRVNRQLAEINGIPQEEHLGKTIWEVVPDLANEAAEQLRRVLDTGEPDLGWEQSGETAAQPGVQRTWIRNVHPIRDESHNIIGLNVAVQEVTERKRLEESRQREETFRTLAEHSPDVVVRFDRNLRYLYINPAMEATSGIRREDFLGKTSAELGLSGAFVDLLTRHLRDVFESGLESHTEFALRTLPKGKRYFEARIVPEFGADGRVETVVMVSRDVTERKRLEEGLREANAELEQRESVLAEAQRIAHVGSWEWDLGHNAFSWSDEMFRIAGQQTQLFDLTLGAMLSVIHPDDRERIGRRLRRAVDTGEGFVEEHRVVRPDGAVRVVESRAEVVRGSDGGAVSLRGTWVDITERKRAEEALERLIASTPEGVLVLDREGNVLLANPAAERLFGKTEGEMRGAPLGLPLATGEWTEITLLTPDRRQTTVEMRVVDVEWHERPALVVSLHDMTERRMLERERIEHLDRLQRALFQTIQAIATTVGKRDPYTAGHQTQVARLAAAIGEEMNLPPERVEGLRLGGAILDIGKIYVPAGILNRPGPLSREQSALVKSHPQVGYDIVRDVDFPWPIAEMIRDHHERLDGSGYPQGLTNGAISLEGRILAVADAVSAIASHRPYRPALGVEGAMEEIQSGRGTRYDPEVVDACLRLLRDKAFKLEPENEFARVERPGSERRGPSPPEPGAH